MRVVVVGAGISGLTCAVQLRDAGHAVGVVTAEPPTRTTSTVAAALWYPYRALPQDAVTRWAAATYEVLAGLVDDRSSGVRMRTGRELFWTQQAQPWWRAAVPALDRVAPADLPAGFADGYLLELPVVDTSMHLPWLIERLAVRGVAVRTAELQDLADADPAADIVINCTGLGAQRLAADDTLVPVRGQVVVVEQVGIDQWLLAQSDPTELSYVIPRERTVVLGGTAEVGQTDPRPDPATAAAILRRCTALEPRLAGATVLEHKVGVRPTRPAVRLEADRLASGQPVVHDYGHGGAGVTLSYGCAADVARLVAAL